MAVVTSIVAAGVAVAGAAAQYDQGKKAAKKQKKANKAQRKINQLKNKQAKRAFLRNFRMAQASTLTESVLAGAGLGSSRFQGTLASQTSQAFQAVDEFNEMDRLGGLVTRYQNAAAERQVKAAGYGAISSIASSFISFGAGGGGGAPTGGG